MNDNIEITSRDNAKLVSARKVRDGKVDSRIFIEGVRLAEEAVRSGLMIQEGFSVSGFGEAEREAAPGGTASFAGRKNVLRR